MHKQRCTKWLHVIGLIALLLAGWVGGLGGLDQHTYAADPTPESTVTDEQIVAAINKAVDGLLKARKPQTRTWEDIYTIDNLYGGGETSLVLYSLLHVGQSINDKRLKANSEDLQPAIKFVAGLNPKSTYVACLQANALQLLPRRGEYTKPLEQAAKLLVDAQFKNGAHAYELGKNYNANADDAGDASNSQYGLLGTWAAFDSGVGVPGFYWHNAEKWWRSGTAPEGGWGYNQKAGAKVSMTAAGISSLLIATEQTDRTLQLETKADRDVDRGLAYLAKNFNAENCDSYTLYSVERCGLLSGRKFFDRLNWFETGAAQLLKSQKEDGMWVEYVWDAKSPSLSTALSLLFLARGRNPVIFNKIQYDGNWHSRPRDLANLTTQISRQFERPFNWQVVPMNVDTDEWMDAPAVLLEGNVDPKFTDVELAQLRRYIGSGGLVFSVAVGNAKESAGFTTAMTRYANDLIPNIQMREIPPDHALFSIFAKIKNPPKLYGLSNGVRELWLHCPEDLGALWQMKDLTKKGAYELPANIYFYACGKEELRSKLRTTAIRQTRERPSRNITLGRLQYAGNWNPEFGAWERFSRLGAAKFHTQIDTVTLTPDTLSLDKARILWMTGTEKFDFNDDQVNKLRTYLDGGGMLLADAAGGSPEFTTSFKALIAKLYPKEEMALLDDRHSIFSDAVDDGTDVRVLKYRPFTELTIGQVTGPRIYGLNRAKASGGKRLVVLFSPYDLTCGISAVRAWGVDGYNIASAELLTRNLILYSAAVSQPSK